MFIWQNIWIVVPAMVAGRHTPLIILFHFHSEFGWSLGILRSLIHQMNSHSYSGWTARSCLGWWPLGKWWVDGVNLTHRQLEMHGCVISTVATDALVLKHQAINSYNAGQVLYWTIFIKHFKSKTALRQNPVCSTFSENTPLTFTKYSEQYVNLIFVTWQWQRLWGWTDNKPLPEPMMTKFAQVITVLRAS